MKRSEVKRINEFYFNLLINDKRVLYEINEDKILISDTFNITILNKEDYYLKELTTYNFKINFIDKLILEDYRLINNITVNEKERIALLDNEVMIDQKYYKLYKGNNFYITNGDRSPVIVKNDFDEVIGYILPIKKY